MNDVTSTGQRTNNMGAPANTTRIEAEHRTPRDLAAAPREAIAWLLWRYARSITNGDLDGWLACFDSDARYKVITDDNVAIGGLVGLMDDRGPGLIDRVTVIRDYLNFVPQRYRHLLWTGPEEQVGDNEWRVDSHFVIFRTKDYGVTEFMASGEYNDRIRITPNDSQFTERTVIVDAGIVADWPYPL